MKNSKWLEKHQLGIEVLVMYPIPVALSAVCGVTYVIAGALLFYCQHVISNKQLILHMLDNVNYM